MVARAVILQPLVAQAVVYIYCRADLSRKRFAPSRFSAVRSAYV